MRTRDEKALNERQGGTGVSVMGLMMGGGGALSRGYLQEKLEPCRGARSAIHPGCSSCFWKAERFMCFWLKCATQPLCLCSKILSPNLLRSIFMCASAALAWGELAGWGHAASLEQQGHCRQEQRKTGGPAAQGGSGHPASLWWGCAEACALTPLPLSAITSLARGPVCLAGSYCLEEKIQIVLQRKSCLVKKACGTHFHDTGCIGQKEVVSVWGLKPLICSSEPHSTASIMGSHALCPCPPGKKPEML